MLLKRIFKKLFPKPKIHFLHIGKTGGSNIKSVLRELPPTKFDIQLHNHLIKLTDCPVGEKVFFCVRDPLKKFVSGFYSRQRQGKPKFDYPWSEGEVIAFKKFNTPNELGLALSPDHPDYSKAVEAMGSIGHVKRPYWFWFIDEDYLKKRLPDILFVCQQERLNQDLRSLKSYYTCLKNVLYLTRA